ncbi:MAG: hypothetical protein K8M05_01805 [Deltaproteobacteria bacterium]|nr:hypothetical protein [Kofleriaceae bacterium]
MDQMIEAIRAAVAEGATAEQKSFGAQACRTILTALEVEPGKAMVLAGTPPASPLAGISAEQAIDLLIARLSALVPADGKPSAGSAPPERTGLRIALVQPPARPRPRGGR